MTSSPTLLFKNGTVLFHERKGDDDRITPLPSTDILVENGIIQEIGQNIGIPPGADVIDCTDRIVSPGMIDTHNHLWMTQMKARHADQTLLEYMYSGAWQSYNFDPDDIYWGQLGGCLEAIDAGTTTGMDQADLTYSEQHVNAAIDATADSGLRCFFCYVPIARLKQWSPFTPETDLVPEWMLEHIKQLATSQPFGDGRVQLGFGFDLWMLPKEQVTSLWEQVRNWGVRLFTSHYCKNRVFGLQSIPEIMKDYGLLRSDVIIAHATQASSDDAKLIVEAGASVSVTPESEAQMSLGLPLAFRGDVPVSLGIDCHFIGPSDIMSQMRLSLHLARQARNQTVLDADQFPVTNIGSSAQAFNLGTISGARAVQMEDQIGSIAMGKRADIVVFNATSPTMACASQHDPVTAIVRHATIRDVEVVVVDGVVRKRDGVLVPVRTSPGRGDGPGEMTWKAIVKRLIESRNKIAGRVEKLDMEVGRKAAIKAFRIDENKLV